MSPVVRSDWFLKSRLWDETVVLPQFLLVEKFVAFSEVVDIPVRDAETGPPWSSDHGDFQSCSSTRFLRPLFVPVVQLHRCRSARCSA